LPECRTSAFVMVPSDSTSTAIFLGRQGYHYWSSDQGDRQTADSQMLAMPRLLVLRSLRPLRTPMVLNVRFVLRWRAYAKAYRLEAVTLVKRPRLKVLLVCVQLQADWR
jgi:hypothetical protein